MKKSYIYIFFVLIFFILLFKFKDIFFKKNFEKKDEKKNGLYIFNVLEKEDFLDARIKGSSHMSFENIDNILSKIDKSNKLVFYCANYFCTSSDDAALKAFKNGFKNVYVYAAGMAEWYQLALNDKNYEYEGKAEAEYLNFVIPKRKQNEENEKNFKYFKIISSEELQDLIKSNTLYLYE